MMKPWLLIPAKLAHHLAPYGLQLFSAFREPHAYTWRPLDWCGLRFENRLGVAGGVDKDGEQIEDWWRFGVGFVEVGTVTPLPQGPNEGRIIGRDVEAQALWNRMGFPGAGMRIVRQNLADLPPKRTTPVFVNIGKNRATSNEDAAKDYVTCMNHIGALADAFVINISSPNTTGLRELFRPENFAQFLAPILEARAPLAKPLLLKLSPDLSDEDLENVVMTAHQQGIDGFIATNTTLAREPGSPFPIEGGVSGKPLAERSKSCLKEVVRLLGKDRGKRLIISAGGVMTPEDVSERIALGADLVQVYSALIYEGPLFFRQVARTMA